MNGTLWLADVRKRFADSKDQCDRALAQVPFERWTHQLGPESNSIATIMLHMAGNMLSRWTDFLTSDGEKPDRDRDAEFENPAALSRVQLLARWESGWACLFSAIDALSEADLDRTVTIRTRPLAVTSAINRQIQHYGVHTGQLVLLAKHLVGESWNTLSVARGASKAFNTAMASDAPVSPQPAEPARSHALSLETERLRLRRLTLKDAAFIRALVNDPDWIRFIGDRAVHSLADARAYLERGYLALYRKHGFGLWLVEDRESRKSLGLCGLLKRETLPDVDLGFAFLPAARGNGYAREAAAASLRHAHDALGLVRVVAICTPDNAASRRVLEGVGMRFEKLFRMKDDAEELCLYASGAEAALPAAPTA